jgi:hypothetical protein
MGVKNSTNITDMEDPLKYGHSGINGVMLVLELFRLGAAAAAEAAHRRLTRAKRQRRRAATRSGEDTPLWRILAREIKAECKKRGDKARLARSIGVPRQRMNEFLNHTRAQPDAERTLMLLQWLAGRYQQAQQAASKPGKP